MVHIYNQISKNKKKTIMFFTIHFDEFKCRYLSANILLQHAFNLVRTLYLQINFKLL